jgi:hypothetical protein
MTWKGQKPFPCWESNSYPSAVQPDCAIPAPVSYRDSFTSFVLFRHCDVPFCSWHSCLLLMRYDRARAKGSYLVRYVVCCRVNTARSETNPADRVRTMRCSLECCPAAMSILPLGRYRAGRRRAVCITRKAPRHF